MFVKTVEIQNVRNMKDLTGQKFGESIQKNKNKMNKTKLPNISTKGGDNGETSLWSGDRVSKNHPAIKCVCELDLFDSAIGLIYSKLNDSITHLEIADSLDKIQSRLVYLKGEIATHPREWDKFRKKFKPITDVDVDYIDKACQNFKEALEGQGYEIKGWIRYGEEGDISAIIDYCRGLCRKSEIEIYELDDALIHSKISEPIKKYMNRLSDYLFWIARFLRKVS